MADAILQADYSALWAKQETLRSSLKGAYRVRFEGLLKTEPIKPANWQINMIIGL